MDGGTNISVMVKLFKIFGRGGRIVDMKEFANY